jgi:hypothetical protein
LQRKRQRQDSDSEGDSLRVKLQEVETNLKDKEYAIAQLEKQVTLINAVYPRPFIEFLRKTFLAILGFFHGQFELLL